MLTVSTSAAHKDLGMKTIQSPHGIKSLNDNNNITTIVIEVSLIWCIVFFFSLVLTRRSTIVLGRWMLWMARRRCGLLCEIHLYKKIQVSNPSRD